MSSFVAFTIFGLYSGAAYAIAASGLVLTYSTTRVFNVAHGAFGMLLSFVFWDFSVRQGLPTWLAVVLVLFVVAPAVGWFIQRFIARGLGESPVSVSLVVTVALLVICIGLAQKLYPANTPRSVLGFFPGKTVHVGATVVTYHQIITILASVAVAAGLYLLLNRTRIGVAMRASVDNPELLRLFGGKPDQVAALSWMIGISLAGLGGILLAPIVGLDYYALTLLVINAFAAAALGRLKSLPLSFAGAMGLGLASSYLPGYGPHQGFFSTLQYATPALFLFAVVILAPQAQLRIGQVKGIVSAPLPSAPKAVGSGGGYVVVVALLAGAFAEPDLLKLGTAIFAGLLILSMVLLTGYGGHVSLAQVSFAGVGALVYAKLDQPNLAGLLIAALVAGLVGALVALPVLRLTGLYLALATLAFALIMDKVVFQAKFAFGFNGVLTAHRIFGISQQHTGRYVVVMGLFFVLLSLGLLLLRRGRIGRMLIALRDSPAACGTLGLDQRWFRVGMFAMSASIAGLAGALYGGLRGTIGSADFFYFNSFIVLLCAVVFGVTSMTGAAAAGIAYMIVKDASTGPAAVLSIILGVGAILLARDPNGLANLAFRLGRVVERYLGPRLAASLPSLPGRGRDLDGDDEDAQVANEDTQFDDGREPAHVAS